MIKKVLSGIFALSAAAAMASISASAKSINVGDIDCNQSIDIEDAVIILNHINGAQPINTSFGRALANIDCNETVDIEDAVAIINHINGVKPINVNEDNVEIGEKLKALREKYKDGYSMKLTDLTPWWEYDNIVNANNDTDDGINDDTDDDINVEYLKSVTEYVTDGDHYYIGFSYENEDGTSSEPGLFQVRATDDKVYYANPDDKWYSVHDRKDHYWEGYDADPLGLVDNDYMHEHYDTDKLKYIKTEKIGDMTYEYYNEAFEPEDMIIYVFDKNSDLIAIYIADGSFPYNDPYPYPHDTEYSVDSIGPVDMSKLDPPDLTGYTEANFELKSYDLEVGEKMKAFINEYADGYSIEMKADSHNISKTYIADTTDFHNYNTHYYTSVTRDNTLESVNINSTDGLFYHFNPSDKTYYKVPVRYSYGYESFLPEDMVYFKTETKNGMTYEYYRAYVDPEWLKPDVDIEEVYATQDMMVYGFDSDSNLKSVQYCPHSVPGIIYDVVSLSPLDKSKLDTPDLTGYTQVDRYDF